MPGRSKETRNNDDCLIFRRAAFSVCLNGTDFAHVCVSSDNSTQVRQKNLGKQSGNKAFLDKNVDDVVEQLTSKPYRETDRD